MTRTRTVTRPIWTLGLLSLFVGVAPSVAQIPVELTINGPAAVFENSDADYTATALFDNGQEFEVTLLSDWSVDPDTYAWIDQFGRLTTQQVPKDQQIVVMASFTWDEVTVDDQLDVTIVDIPLDEGVDPWPTWQRTASRLGRTSTIGPRTPTIAWSVRVDTGPGDAPLYEFAGILDAHGRLFVGHSEGLAAVNTITREILWQFVDAFSVLSAPTLYEGKVLFGSVDDFFYCVNAGTGEEIWKAPAEPHPNRSCAVDDAGVVYYASQQSVLYARRVADGSEVWTRMFPDSFRAPPTLDGLGRLYIPNVSLAQWLAIDTDNGDTVWAFDLPSDGAGLSCYENTELYVASRRYLLSVDAEIGAENWRFWTEEINGGTSAIRHDGVVYILASDFGTGWAFAVTPDGEELWRYGWSNRGIGMPGIVDGAGTFYFCTRNNVESGWVHALRSDGTDLWVKEMPDQVSSSPTLAPDGTLYVMCSDKNLYAFRDPVGDLDFDGDIDLDDFAKFEECLTGPRLWGEAAKTTPGCELLDFDSDWDVDWTDLGQFQLAFTGAP